ncbi:MAG: hypothetical protein HFI91_13945 [Lachnospiraceae bacterium]|nr:hypothetical protein [Lachnospiraceae bacterium]
MLGLNKLPGGITGRFTTGHWQYNKAFCVRALTGEELELAKQTGLCYAEYR